MPESEEPLKTLIRFLDSIKGKAQHLFILGDLFECWFEYPGFIPRPYFPVLAQLSMLNRSGVKLYYLPGNHDLRLGDFFARELGMKVLPPIATASFQGSRALLLHGHQLDRTLGNRWLQAVLGSSINQRFFSLLDPRLGMAAAQLASRLSRRRGLFKDQSGELARFARRELESGYQIVIMAHSHSPIICKIGQGYYLNLGDWCSHRSYGVVEGGTPRLEFFTP